MFKTAIFFSLFCFSFQGQYLFNNKKDSVFFSNYVNELFVKEGTPLCFDGTLRVHPTDKKNIYLVEVLDTVTRDTGKLNIAAYTETPEGGREKIFIDKFSFVIKNSPQPTLYLGNASPQETVDTANLDLSIRFLEQWPKANFQITESTIILNKKEVVTIKSNQLNQSVIRKIKRLFAGAELRISVVYKDPLLRAKRISGVFYL
tara:strand:- start:70 stop:678 length:609 start_codon:yes stop_codon:yes gene_type:complete